MQKKNIIAGVHCVAQFTAVGKINNKVNLWNEP